MKLFKSLLVAPATLGLLAPLSVSAGETTLEDISKYSNTENIDFANAFVNDAPRNTPLLAGGEGLVDTSFEGGFSETTSASFSIDAAIGSIDGDTTSEATTFDYQFNIGLSTSFTGEDSLDIAIDSGSTAASTADNPMAFDTGAGLTVDGVTYSFPVGGVSMIVGVDTDLSAAFSGACTYSAFTDYMSDCGTVNSIGSAGNGFTAAGSYAFDSGFSLAAGISGTADGANTAANKVGILSKEGTDSYGIEAAYAADSWGLSVGYVYDDNNTSAETTTWGINGNYSFDIADLSVGYETEETSGTEKTGYFVGLTFPEVGPGSVSVGAATSANYASSATEYMIYEAAYSYPVNDGLTITPGVFIEEKAGDDLTGVIVKSSFSF
jgi:hypothetical protein